MDKSSFPKPSGLSFSLAAAGEAWSWRLTAPDGSTLGGLAPDPATARRSAAFAAYALSALERTQQRWF